MSQDGFGSRTLSFDPQTGEPVEVLSFAPALAAVPEFAAAVGERVARLARVRHTMYARVRRIERPSENALLLYSDHVPGWRLSDVLAVVARERWTLDISAVLALLRQLIPAVALFSRHQRDATIGTIGPERLILTPQGRLVVAEFVLAPGLEQLQYSRERQWREFRVAMPPTVNPARIPPSADVVGIGIVALSLLLGRLLNDDEYLIALGDLVDSLTETSGGKTKQLSPTFCSWIARALQFEGESSYDSTQAAQVAFEEMLAKERAYVTSAAQLNQFIVTYERLVGDPPVPTAASAAPAAEAAGTPVAAIAHPAADATVAPIAPIAAPALDARVASAFAPGASADEPVAPASPREEAAASYSPSTGSGLFQATSRDGETSPAPPAWRKHAMLALVALVIVEGAAIGWLVSRGGPAILDRGELSIQSRPAAARVTIDGEERGITPYTTELSAGSHIVEVRVGRSEPRVLPLMIRAGIQTGLYVELQSVATVGGLEVRTDPPNAVVTVGGQQRGVTPLVLHDLPPGEVEVIVRLGGREVQQTVRIEPGITSQLVVPLGR